MRSVSSSVFSVLGKLNSGALVTACLLGCLGFGSPALAQLPQVQTPGVACAGTYNPNLSCNSNDIEINDVSQLLPADDPRAQPPVIACVAGETVTLDIKFTTLLNANSRYDSLIWIGEEGQNPRGTAGTCYVTSLPDDPDSPFILDLELNGDQCNDTNSSGTLEVDQYLFQVEVACIDQYTPDPNGTDPDDVLPVPDGELDVFFLITWFQNNTLDCGIGEGQSMVPGVNPKCDAAILTGIDVEVLPAATIQVVKESNNGVGDFPFTSDVPGLGDFSLDTTGDGTESTAVIPLEGADVGLTYNIAETIPEGWLLADPTCSNGDTPDAVTPLDAQDVICTFINTLDSATINIVKMTQGGTGGPFPINWNGPNTSGGVALDTTDFNPVSDTVITTETGTFTLEELVPPGWALSGASCSNDDTNADVGNWDPESEVPTTITGIDLSPGDSITCTFTNSALGTVTLIKETVGGGGSFDFVTNVPGLGTNITIAGNGNTGSISASNVPAGIYSIVETVPPGWNLDTATCSDNSPPNALDLSDGETVSCTFTNTKLGTVIVEKQTLPDNSTQVFDFEGNLAGTIGNGGQIILSDQLPGIYTSTETVPSGWVLTDIVCDDEESGTPSVGDVPNATATFNLDAGETVKCIFLNTQDGTIEVVKSLPLTGPASETFNFTSNFNGDFELIGDLATTGLIPVSPGSGYTVSENDPTLTGWAMTDAMCEDGSDPLTNIEVSPGENVRCVFTNTPLGSAVIIKDTVGGNGEFGFTADAPIGVFTLDTTDQFTASTGDLFDYILTAGSYDVTEDSIWPGFELTNAECSAGPPWVPGSPTITMDVQLAETVSCTFTNTADGTLIIRKKTLPAGAEQGFEFTGTANGIIHDYDTTLEEIVVSGQPGIYTSAEVVPDGWEITGIDCVDDLQSVVTVGENDVSVNLAAGETVICTFENSAQGSITIEKFTQGGLGDFQFTSDLGGFTLDTLNNGNPDSITFSGLASGTYIFAEMVPANWTLSNIQCSEPATSTITIGGAGGFDPGDQGVTIGLLNGEAIVCTFVNDADGSITVTKVTDPAGSAQSFDFTGAITASLTDGQESTIVRVPPGNYDVSETAVPGWDTTGISCSDDDSTGDADAGTANFVVAPGEIVNCEFTNTIQRGNIIVRKLTDPDTSTAEFEFTTNYDQAPFMLANGGQDDSGALLPSSEATTYSVAETPVDGWGTAVLCESSLGGEEAADAIDLDPAETVTCTFTNTIQRGNIIVRKLTDPDTSTAEFEFTTNYDQAPFMLANGGQDDSGALLPSSEATTYSVAETPVDGWGTAVLCESSLGGEEAADAIDLDPAETVTCTFTNTIQRGNIIVRKLTDPDTSTAEFEFTTNYDQAPFMLANGGQDDSGALLPSSEATTYSVAETPVDGWGTAVLCESSLGGEEAADAIDLDPAETVTCTFTNTIQRGNIIVRKLTDPDTSTAEFEFTTNYDQAPFMLANGGQDDSGALLPSSEATTYSVAETPVDGWGTAVLCESSLGGEEAADAIDLDPAETVTCTFTNTIQLGSITIVKHADSDGTFQFGFSGPEFGAFLLEITTEGGSGEEGFTGLLPGSYSINELNPAPFILLSATCNNGDLPGDLTLDAGEDIICIFINGQPVPVPVNSTWALLLLTLMMLATGLYFRPAAMRKF